MRAQAILHRSRAYFGARTGINRAEFAMIYVALMMISMMIMNNKPRAARLLALIQ